MFFSQHAVNLKMKKSLKKVMINSGRVWKFIFLLHTREKRYYERDIRQKSRVNIWERGEVIKLNRCQESTFLHHSVCCTIKKLCLLYVSSFSSIHKI